MSTDGRPPTATRYSILKRPWVRGPNTAIGCPPPAERTAVECLQVIFSDEWAHVQFANRDLAILEEEYA